MNQLRIRPEKSQLEAENQGLVVEMVGTIGWSNCHPSTAKNLPMALTANPWKAWHSKHAMVVVLYRGLEYTSGGVSGKWRRWRVG
jgi:hypothetical protein